MIFSHGWHDRHDMLSQMISFTQISRISRSALAALVLPSGMLTLGKADSAGEATRKKICEIREICVRQKKS